MSEKASQVHKQSEKCPYWSSDSGIECGLSVDGVYIPMPKHIKMYCSTEAFVKCRQYVRGCVLEAMEDKGDRRKKRRFAEQLYLDVVVCDPKKNPAVKNKYRVRTIDVSLGGLRIEGPTNLATDTVVGFELDHNLSAGSLAGVGAVKWCEPQRGSDKFEFGLAFSDDNTSLGLMKLLEM